MQGTLLVIEIVGYALALLELAPALKDRTEAALDKLHAFMRAWRLRDFFEGIFQNDTPSYYISRMFGSVMLIPVAIGYFFLVYPNSKMLSDYDPFQLGLTAYRILGLIGWIIACAIAVTLIFVVLWIIIKFILFFFVRSLTFIISVMNSHPGGIVGCVGLLLTFLPRLLTTSFGPDLPQNPTSH